MGSELSQHDRQIHALVLAIKLETDRRKRDDLFARLIDHPYVRATIGYYTRDYEEDLRQQVLLVVWVAIRKWSPATAKYMTYLNRSLQHERACYRRRAKRLREREIPLDRIGGV